ncbi:uncharacterized protein PAC_13099 [Phialocephala subalpina]|uniref:Kelch repeat protein n=1 Tax=Phialocephala subalpina TaxID=576137 RepID=A0A1L7XDV5_9HELO|nr:uncharacterized protein PAC_13099 [Phialocephala subalpina]
MNYTATSLSASQHLLRPGGLGSSTNIVSTGYFVGEYIYRGSDVNASPNGHFQNTITSYNLSSGQWENERVTRIDGRGLMVVIGGRDRGTKVSQNSGTYFGFDNVTIYDPYIDVWEVPAVRDSFCAVTVAGDNGTYEIFIYGGVNQQIFGIFNDIYVLTTPGFVWFKAQGDAMVPDLFVQGIGIFDMMDLVWKDSCDPIATSYKSPQVVKDCVLNLLAPPGLFESSSLLLGASKYEPQTSRTWISPDKAGKLRRLHLKLNIQLTHAQECTVSVSATPAANGSSSAPTSSSQPGSGNNRAEIIGSVVGSVVGIIGVILAVLSLWFAWRQWKIMKAAKELEQSSANTSAQQSDPEDGTSTSDPLSLVSDSGQVSTLSSEGARGSRGTEDIHNAESRAQNG